ncbi:MAG TPA: Rrf2 family transcriptional regulator [Myxococcota bacterium]|nr:Rrf2 family transcriptional regulator [Myxococcota bacterium]HOA13919.1 Rrf2 family transcriptional regulator [Myxococcota bacterium]HOD00589.1 Rrf2 family transcriptional regulator [Myxococcota bacterium]HOH76685.1 Rrf2 family transcriptional regulator [Myxococcota bacterium]HPV05150.1 Rrf2 family transcriptional regulator [Myxococcota bacterium]
MEGLSTRGRYATRVMLYLVGRGRGDPVRISEISTAEAIPQNYLEQLLVRLKVNGFVRSVRGARGGYVISCDPASVTVMDILEAVEGPIQLAPCIRETCTRGVTCVTRGLWREASDAMNDVFRSYSLQSLADRVKEIETQSREPDYSI